MGRKSNDVRVNERIRARTVRLIGVDGKQLGIMSSEQALERARKDGLDLVEVAPNSDPPVCRIMDYGKYKYQAAKKVQEGKKKAKSVQLKEVRIRPHTEEHDLNFKIKNMKKFLEKKDRVKISVHFRGREMAYMDAGIELLNRIAEEVSEFGTVEQPPTREGWRLTMVLVPN
ncbi:MAG: translation initiation factor IF-3 [Deltaproteobacteria bacterium]|nr:translation initiation factor IF-3 [Deltaproteobacteria bacterium]MBW2017925.1 translation initiation factor IF-3 [Deltaproteobacteria bacterium]MBW2130538.1 translation initiation factor IF-3 [Deltaproteobacteria bacterium]MBW2305234.1 translation initiation factor IF-3 [Deltaproteobacteria bacterium]